MKIGIFKLRNHLKEESYFQLYLKIRNKSKNEDINFKDNFIDEKIFLLNKENIQIEGIFMDVSQSFMKRQTQINSLILYKSIHDIKSPLFLLKQVIENYKSYNRRISEQISKLINSMVRSYYVGLGSNNMKNILNENN